jgi:zinc D-Ala-D-Ala carboxypeptidase
MIDQRVATQFWLSEFLRSDLAVRQGIDNLPHATALANIINILGPGMQRVRDALGGPVLITSGFRSQELERALKRMPEHWNSTSQHAQGLAADFIAPQFGTPRSSAKYLMERSGEIRFDQLIYEGGWVHISFAAPHTTARSDVLTAHFMGGAVTYSRGLS